MSQRLKRLDWETNTIKLDFAATPEMSLGWALKAISEYKAIPTTLTHHTEPDSRISTTDVFLRDSKGELVTPNDVVNTVLDLVYAEWDTLVLWVAKDRWKLFDITSSPLPELVMRIYEPRAKLLIAELELWDAIYDASSEFRNVLPYASCVEAWVKTQLETKRNDFSDIFYGGNRQKVDALVKQKKTLIDVNGANPLQPDDTNNTHRYNMLDAALSIARPAGRREQEAVDRTRKAFRGEVWFPYLNALGSYTKSLRSGVTLSDGSVVKAKTIFVDKNGTLMIQSGRQARPVLSLLELVPKKVLHQRGKYPRK